MVEEYRNEAEIHAVVRGFELCTTGKDAFTHREHLAVAVHYLTSGDEREALIKMREGLHRFLAHHQVDSAKYNETITQFWIRVVADHIRKADVIYSRVQITNAVVARFLNFKEIMAEYYSTDLLQSTAARTGWIEPDLKKLPH